MNLEQSYLKVVEFQTFFDFKVNDLVLRKSLLNEEMLELLTANNEIDKLDGYLDSIYVILGSLHNLGYGFDAEKYNGMFFCDGYEKELYLTLRNLNSDFKKDFPNTNHDEAFAEVHNSNMSKACENLDTVHRTIANRPNEILHYIIYDGKYFVRNEENKLIKSIDYKPANLTRFV